MQDPDKKKEILTQILKEPHRVLLKAESDDEDYQETLLIDSLLKDEFFFYECEADAKHKEDILGRLISIIKQWSFTIAKSKFPESIASQMEAKLYTFGSYRLKVSPKDADIDTVCVVPNFINREEHFFIDLYERLKATPRILEINCIKNAAVPILKMVFDGIQIDMLFAQLDMERIDDGLNLNDNNLLMNLDEKSCKSLNGRRVADMILNSVPNKESFRATLRCIKLWAKNRGINSNSMGYLGGVSWAILVAKICQMFPNFMPNRLIEKFFHYYESWEWDKLPVKIENIVEEKHKPQHLVQWTEATMDQNLMYIITPAFPCMNSSHAVTQASLSILKNFLREGNCLVKDIKARRRHWRDLFQKMDFFSMYKNFIEIDVVGSDEEFKHWLGFVESKIRKLAYNFEWQKVDDSRSYVDILDFHLFPQCYYKTDREFTHSRAYFYGLRLKQEHAAEFAGFKFDFFGTPVAKFMNHIYLEAFQEEKGGFKQGAKINLRVFKIKRSEIEESGYIREKEPDLNNPQTNGNTSAAATVNSYNNNINNNNNAASNNNNNAASSNNNAASYNNNAASYNNNVNNYNSNVNNNNNNIDVVNNNSGLTAEYKNGYARKRPSGEDLADPGARKKLFREEDKGKLQKPSENYLDSLFN